MKRDMELIRKILFEVEDKVDNTYITDNELLIPEFSMEEVAYHCSLLYDAGLINEYKPQDADQGICGFFVSHLTWEGHEFLDKIREDTIWNRTKDTIKKSGLPMVLDVVKSVSTAITSSMVEGVIKGLK